MIFNKKGSQNGAKKRPMVWCNDRVLAPWTPQGTKHVQRHPRDTENMKKVTNRPQKITKKWPTDPKISEKKKPKDIFLHTKAIQSQSQSNPNPPFHADKSDQPDQPDQTDQPDQPDQPDPPNQPDPHYKNKYTPILQSPIPGPAECAKRLNKKNVYIYIYIYIYI